MHSGLAFALRLLDMALPLVQAAPGIIAGFKQSRDKIEIMIREGRDPTPAEWDEVIDLTVMLHEAIQGPQTEGGPPPTRSG